MIHLEDLTTANPLAHVLSRTETVCLLNLTYTREKQVYVSVCNTRQDPTEIGTIERPKQNSDNNNNNIAKEITNNLNAIYH